MASALIGFLASSATLLLSRFAVLLYRYRRSIAKEFQPFGAYVLGNLRLSLGRRVSVALAQQFGVRKYAELKLKNFDTHLFVPSVEGARIEIDTAYVRLSLSGMAEKRVPDEALLADDTGSVLIFGDPGSGKSSLTKKLFRQACRMAYASPASNRLPVHVELRALDWIQAKRQKREAGPWLRSEVIKWASDVRGVHDPGFAIDAWSRKNGLMVLFDGLDEIPESCLGFAVTAIREVITSLRTESIRTSVIVTARTQLRGAIPREFVSGMNLVYTLQPFSPADIFEFLRKWPYRDNCLEEAQRVFATLLERRTLAEMCGNPLILSMYVAQDQRYANSSNLQSVRLPDTRTEFYSSVIGELLLHRRAQQSGVSQGGSEKRRLREELLGRIALDHLYEGDDPTNSISWKNAVGTTRKIVGLRSDDLAEAFLRDLSSSTGIFTEERPGESLRFMHLTLCEYLAAKEISESGKPSFAQLATAAMKSVDGRDAGRLSEVLIFTATLLKRSDRLEALMELTRQGAPHEVVIRAVRECQDYESEAFESSVDKLEVWLQAVEADSWDERWFAAVRLLITCFDELRRVGRPKRLVVKYRTESLLKRLMNEDSIRLDRLFDLWLRYSPAEALTFVRHLEKVDVSFQVTERLVEAMDQMELLNFAISRVSSHPEDHMTWAPLLAEAALRKDLVAEVLLREPAPRFTKPKTGSNSWENFGPTAGTLLGSVLSEAGSSFHGLPRASRQSLPRVGFLSTSSPRMMAKNSGIAFYVPMAAMIRTIFLSVLLSLPVYILIQVVFGVNLVALLGFSVSMGAVFKSLTSGSDKSNESIRLRTVKSSSNLLGIAPSKINRFPPSVAFVVADNGTATTIYGRDPNVRAIPRLSRSRWLMPVPIVVATRHGLLVDLRGLSSHLQASYLLSDVFPFASATEVDAPALEHRRVDLISLMVLLVGPARYRRHMLLPNGGIDEELENTVVSYERIHAEDLVRARWGEKETLALVGSASLVGSMGTGTWQMARNGFLKLFHDVTMLEAIEVQLDTSVEMVRLSGDIDQARLALIPMWRQHLGQILGQKIGLENELRTLIRVIHVSLPAEQQKWVQKHMVETSVELGGDQLTR